MRRNGFADRRRGSLHDLPRREDRQLTLHEDYTACACALIACALVLDLSHIAHRAPSALSRPRPPRFRAQCKEKKTLEVFITKGMRHGERITFKGEADEAVRRNSTRRRSASSFYFFSSLNFFISPRGIVNHRRATSL